MERYEAPGNIIGAVKQCATNITISVSPFLPGFWTNLSVPDPTWHHATSANPWVLVFTFISGRKGLQLYCKSPWSSGYPCFTSYCWGMPLSLPELFYLIVDKFSESCFLNCYLYCCRHRAMVRKLVFWWELWKPFLGMRVLAQATTWQSCNQLPTLIILIILKLDILEQLDFHLAPTLVSTWLKLP